MGILFTGVGIFLIDMNALLGGNIHEILKLIFWEIIVFLTVVYVFYDLLFLEIPESVLLIANILTFFVLAYMSFQNTVNFIPTLENTGNIPFFLSLGLSFLVCGTLYAIML